MSAHGNQARVHRFGDNIDTDVIIGARYLTTTDPAALAPHCMEAVSPGFATRVRPGDVVVAGRIFFRNAINQAFPLVVCPGAVDVAGDGEAINLDMSAGCVSFGDREFRFPPYPAFLTEIMGAGGIVPYVRSKLNPAA